MIPDNVFFTPQMIADASGIAYHTILARIRARAGEGLVPPCSVGRTQSLYSYDEVKIILRKPIGLKPPRTAPISDTEAEQQAKTALLRRQLLTDGFSIRMK